MALLTILVVTALSPNHSLVRFDHMAESLTRRLGPYARDGVIRLVVEHAVSPERLQRLIARYRPDILHIACHGEGSPRVLAMEDRYGRHYTVSAEALRVLVHEKMPRPPPLTVLEACRSRSIADALTRPSVSGGLVFPRVIGLDDDVSPSHGSIIFEGLYHALITGRGLEDALVEARRDLALYAPGAVDNAVLCVSDKARELGGDLRFHLHESFLTRGIAAVDQEDYVFVDPLLRRPLTSFAGRAPELQTLGEFAGRQGPKILHVQGDVAIGKTSLLARWLADEAKQGYWGSARVFAYSFEASAEGRGLEKLNDFLVQALHFFGEHVDPRTLAEDTIAGRAIRLGRLLRQGPSLLVLDAVPTLPRGTEGGEARDVDAFFHPAIAAVIREIVEGGEGLCVFSTPREAGALQLAGGDVQILAVNGLDQDAGRSLLRAGGMVDVDADLARLVARAGGHPLVLSLLAQGFSAVVSAENALGADDGDAPVARVVRALAGGGDVGSSRRALLSGLAACEIAGAGLALEELLGGSPQPSVVQTLVRQGIVTVEPACGGLSLAHPVLGSSPQVVGLPGGSGAAEKAYAGVMMGALTQAEFLAGGRAVALCHHLGESGLAARVYLEKLCGRAEQGRAHSLVGEELELLASLFRRLSDGRVCWSAIDERVARALGVASSGPATILLRAGLALRNLGQLGEAVPPLRAALAALDAANDRSRAAACAGALAQVLAWRGDAGDAAEAIDAAKRGVEAARAAENAGEEARAEAARGHVFHVLGRLEEAREAFDRAESLAGPSGLWSMPGFQCWDFALDRLGAVDHPADLDALAVRLQEARKRHQFSDVDRAAEGLEALARGRLATVYALRGWGYPCGEATRGAWSEARSEAREAFELAIKVFRETQNLWLLPRAFEARTRSSGHRFEEMATSGQPQISALSMKRLGAA